MTAIQVTLDGVVREQASQLKLLNMIMTSSASAEINVELPDDLTFPLTIVEEGAGGQVARQDHQKPRGEHLYNHVCS